MAKDSNTSAKKKSPHHCSSEIPQKNRVLSQAAHALAKDAASTPRKAKEFLLKGGFITKSGKLPAKYK